LYEFLRALYLPPLSGIPISILVNQLAKLAPNLFLIHETNLTWKKYYFLVPLLGHGMVLYPEGNVPGRHILHVPMAASIAALVLHDQTQHNRV